MSYFGKTIAANEGMIAIGSACDTRRSIRFFTTGGEPLARGSGSGFLEARNDAIVSNPVSGYFGLSPAVVTKTYFDCVNTYSNDGLLLQTIEQTCPLEEDVFCMDGTYTDPLTPPGCSPYYIGGANKKFFTAPGPPGKICGDSDFRFNYQALGVSELNTVLTMPWFNGTGAWVWNDDEVEWKWSEDTSGQYQRGGVHVWDIEGQYQTFIVNPLTGVFVGFQPPLTGLGYTGYRNREFGWTVDTNGEYVVVGDETISGFQIFRLESTEAPQSAFRP